MNYDYHQAFSRNVGLISPAEQQALRHTRVALAGLGGVGGAHALTLARTGIGEFAIADPDHFEWANANRQAGCMASSIGKSKCEVTRTMILDINPSANVRTSESVNDATIREFLADVDVVVDGLDFFATKARQLLYREARQRKLPVVAAGPIGTSVNWLVFLPERMAWEDYFAMDLAKDEVDTALLFYLGNCPAMLHLQAIDLSSVRLDLRRGPSLSLAVQLCAGVTAAEVLKLCLGRGPVYAAPYHQQFDAYSQRFSRTHLRWGLRGPLQRLRFAAARRRIRATMEINGDLSGPTLVERK